ncbi:MAG TPA: GTPase domain-containing protein [bacterium]|nr:GTPase domain-containing protein [bacterium]
MAILNYVKREIVAKVVFYGPGLSGKTANIQRIHESMDPANVGELTSLATESDRTLFFDFVPIQLGSIAGLNTRFQLFTVPGQVFYNNTRRKVLEDADGVVFVADSQPEQLENNVESMKNLEENLLSYGKKPTDIPLVLQFNKQDLPGVMSEEELNKVLNKWGAPSLRASCVEGFGVMETLAKISTMVLAHLRDQMTKKQGSGPPPGIKRTYSKEGISDDQVVKNMLEDIAAVGGAQEAAKAQAAEKAQTAPPTPAKPSPKAPPATKPVPAAAKPAAPKPPPAPVAESDAPISPEALLSDLGLDLDSPEATPAAPAASAPPAASRPAAKPAVSREVVSRPASKPAPAAPAPRAASAPPAVAPATEAPSSPSMSRLKPAVPMPSQKNPSGTMPAVNLKGNTPAPAPAPRAAAPARTAEELLDSIDAEEKSGPGSMIQESAGSFDNAGSGGMWEDDGKTANQMKPPSPRGPDPLAFGDMDDLSNKTSVADKIKLAPIPAEPAAEPSFDRRADSDDVRTQAPNLKVVESPSSGASTAAPVVIKSGRATAALMLSIFNTLLLLALAAFNVMAYLGKLPPRP